MNNGALYPCKQCQLSQRNTVHLNTGQFGYHAYQPPDEKPRKSLEETAFDMLTALRSIAYACGSHSGADKFDIHRIAVDAIANAEGKEPEYEDREPYLETI